MEKMTGIDMVASNLPIGIVPSFSELEVVSFIKSVPPI